MTAAAAPRRGAREVIAALGQPKVAVMFALGFSSGLPFMLIGNTLGFWLADEHFAPSAIGFLSAAGMAYILKFLWGGAVDRVTLPLLRRLGRRRSWMLLTQTLVASGLLGMAAAGPKGHFGLFVVSALVTAIAAATQDCVVDAWRIEIAADADEVGLLTSASALGYRTALYCTEALILVIVLRVGWPIAYGLYAAAMSVGLIATLLAREPARADAAMEAVSAAERASPLKALYDAVIGPFVVFFRLHGVATAAMMLLLITLYHLCDFMRGPMVNPYYAALGIPKLTIAAVRTVISLPASLAGIALGGLVTLRIGVPRALILGAILQPIAVALFAVLGWYGGDFAVAHLGPVDVTAFQLIMGFDSVAMSFSGVVLVAYMSSLTSLGYTATQFALLTSAMVWSGKTLKLFSGVFVEALEPGRTLLGAYSLFYLLSGAVGIPAIVVCLIVAFRRSSPPGTPPARP